jgi:hypothetical protein
VVDRVCLCGVLYQAALADVRSRHPFLAVRADWEAGRLEPADKPFPCTDEPVEGTSVSGCPNSRCRVLPLRIIIRRFFCLFVFLSLLLFSSFLFSSDGTDSLAAVRAVVAAQLLAGVTVTDAMARVHLMFDRADGRVHHVLLMGDHMCFDGKSFVPLWHDLMVALTPGQSALPFTRCSTLWHLHLV